MRLGFDFLPVDSYAYSGESSAKTFKRKDKFLDEQDPYYSRRYSFHVSTEHEPPLTTVMGAIRFVLLQMTGTTISDSGESWKKLIGEKSFSIQNPPRSMGLIQSISSVMIHGKIAGKEAYCMKAPLDQNQKCSDGMYNPMKPEDYDPKRGKKSGYLLSQDNKLKWIPDSLLFKTYDQPSVYTAVQGDEDGRYHIQQRCRLLDADLDKHQDEKLTDAEKKMAVSSPSFYVEAVLTEDAELSKIRFPYEQIIALGGRSSMFLCKVSCLNSAVSMPKVDGIQTGDYRLSLITPALITQEILSKCTFAITEYKAYRSATTSYEGGVTLKLEGRRCFLAEAGCVFAFGNNENRSEFESALNRANKELRVCGFGQYITYGGEAK